ncbi:poliovirus receptor-like [Pyxicephalus adspersus]|uniref:Ig-like domain-containing protein n=1 Tax=Pyxicephalus adspersus TaxID=30357 RepID=A0AAV3A001_PYXAD|nr:TPA: hypothetical protein GDO54_003023 [Pyxicephalus adspersus]
MAFGQTLGDVVILGLLVAICFPYMGHSEDIDIVGMQSPIKALLGENITIPCILPTNTQELNPSSVEVSWTKKSSGGEEQVVYKYLGNSHEKQRAGTSMEKSGLKKGNASLILQDVNINDTGEYTCKVFFTPDKATGTIKMKVLAQPNVVVTSSKSIVEPGKEKTFTCNATKFYPKEVKIQWYKYNRSSFTWSSLGGATYTTAVEQNSDGTFNVTSLLIVVPNSLKEDGDKFSCNVTHESLDHDKNVTIILKVEEPSGNLLSTILNINLIPVILAIIAVFAVGIFKVPPKISDIVGLDDLVHMKRSALTFMVSGFKLKEIEIHLYIKRAGLEEKYKVASWKYLSHNVKQSTEDHASGGIGMVNYSEVSSQKNEILPLKLKGSFMFYSCLCSTHITPDKDMDEGAELFIEVIHPARTFQTVSQMLNISEAERVGKPFTSKNLGTHVGQ